jgi:hypothetical protein
VQVIALSDDGNHVKLQLCTGTVIEVPASILKGVTPLGTVECMGQRKTLAMGWIDGSTDTGKLINRMADEIQRFSAIVPPPTGRHIFELPIGFTFWFDPPDGLGPFQEFNA